MTFKISCYFSAFLSQLLKSSLYIKNISLSFVTYCKYFFPFCHLSFEFAYGKYFSFKKIIFRYLNVSTFNFESWLESHFSSKSKGIHLLFLPVWFQFLYLDHLCIQNLLLCMVWSMNLILSLNKTVHFSQYLVLKCSTLSQVIW